LRDKIDGSGFYAIKWLNHFFGDGKNVCSSWSNKTEMALHWLGTKYFTAKVLLSLSTKFIICDNRTELNIK